MLWYEARKCYISGLLAEVASALGEAGILICACAVRFRDVRAKS
jgi:hypothetical protein